jgi:hypothetical protein
MGTQPHPEEFSSERAVDGSADRPGGRGRRDGIRRRWAWFVVLVVVSLLGVVGCATTVTPPAQVQNPVEVYLADYGRHSSLVLPRDAESMVEYAFGEWRWFALNQTGVFGAFRAICWGSRGTLGSRIISTVDHGWQEESFHGVELFSLQVEQEKAGALVERLEERWLRGESEAVYNAVYDFHFVPVEQRYHLFRNCNPVVAGWLRELGCRVPGPALLSNWRLQEAGPVRQQGGGTAAGGATEIPASGAFGAP